MKTNKMLKRLGYSFVQAAKENFYQRLTTPVHLEQGFLTRGKFTPWG